MRGPQDKGDKQRRFKEHYPAKGVIPHPSPSVALGRSIFYRSRVKSPDERLHVLISGENNLKIGKRVSKGKWNGMPIYTLTLEERATCSSDCHHWRTCCATCGACWASNKTVNFVEHSYLGVGRRGL